MKSFYKNIKPVLALLLTVVMLMPTFAAVSADGDIILSTTKTTIYKDGSEFNVSIGIENLTEICGISFMLVYDKSVFTVSDLVVENIGELELEGVIVPNLGRVRITGNLNPLRNTVITDTNKLTIASMKFKLSSDAELKTYPLNYKDVVILKEQDGNTVPINVIEEPGSITVSEKKSTVVVDSGAGKKYYEGDKEPGEEQPGEEQPGGEQPKGAEKFKDLGGFEWAYESIDELVKAGIISGTSETTYEPQRSITRAEFCKLIAAAFGFEASDASISFSDVKSDAWYYLVVISAAKAGIVTGYEDGSFRPEASITREEMAAMLVRAFKAAGVEVPEGEMTFADADEMGDWSVDLIASLVKMGIVSGRGNNRFVPRDNLTRAESAKVIYSAYKIMQEKESE